VPVMIDMEGRWARTLDLDPAEVRLRNFIAREEFPFDVGLLYRDGKPMIYDSGDYVACLHKAMEIFDYPAMRQEQAAARQQGRHIGIGMATFVEGGGLGPYEGAVVRVEPAPYASSRLFGARVDHALARLRPQLFSELCLAAYA